MILEPTDGLSPELKICLSMKAGSLLLILCFFPLPSPLKSFLSEITGLSFDLYLCRN